MTEGLGFAFADARAERYGVARAGPAGARVLLFAGRAAVAAHADAALSVAERDGGWHVRFDGVDGSGFALDFSPLADAVERPGAAGDDQPCRVTGTVRADGRELDVKALGQRSRTASEPDWDRVALARSVSVWTEPAAAALSATRPAAARHHAEEATSGALWERGVVVPLDGRACRRPTTRQGARAAPGLELWPAGESDVDWARRGAGELLCEASLELGALRTDCAFMRWHIEGQAGVGCYEIVRPATVT